MTESSLICLRAPSQHSRYKSTGQDPEAVKEVRGGTWLTHSRLTVLITNQHHSDSLFCCSLPAEHSGKDHKTRSAMQWSGVTYCTAPRRPCLYFGLAKGLPLRAPGSVSGRAWLEEFLSDEIMGNFIFFHMSYNFHVLWLV